MGAILLAIGRFIVSKSLYAMITKIIVLLVLAGGIVLLGLNDLSSRMEACQQPDATPIACFFQKSADASQVPGQIQAPGELPGVNPPETTPPKVITPGQPTQPKAPGGSVPNPGPNTTPPRVVPSQPNQGPDVCVYIPGVANACGRNPAPAPDPAPPTTPVTPEPTDSGPTTGGGNWILPPETPSGDGSDTPPPDQGNNAGCGIPGDQWCD